MHIKAWGNEIKDVSNCTVEMKSGDSLSVAYTDKHGKTHVINIVAQNLVMMVSHKETESAMVCSPSGFQYVSGNRM